MLFFLLCNYHQNKHFGYDGKVGYIGIIFVDQFESLVFLGYT
jgi:hypothetical protein